jgi:hypothetical protein
MLLLQSNEGYILSSVYLLIEGSQLSCVLYNWIFNYLHKPAIVKLLNIIDGKECVTTEIQYLSTVKTESSCLEETNVVQYIYIHTYRHIYIYMSVCVCDMEFPLKYLPILVRITQK